MFFSMQLYDPLAGLSGAEAHRLWLRKVLEGWSKHAPGMRLRALCRSRGACHCSHSKIARSRVPTSCRVTEVKQQQ
eukprot:4830928-Amphidinium_carterae.1